MRDVEIAFQPLRHWPQGRTRTPASERQNGPFRGKGGHPTPLSTTLGELDHELRMIDEPADRRRQRERDSSRRRRARRRTHA